MNLEKLTLSSADPCPYLWHDIHGLGSTPIDLFCNGPYLWGDEVLEQLKSYDIWIGKYYGTEGITITEVFGPTVDRDNTIYCIPIEKFVRLSKVQATRLLTELRLMICDYSEGGFLLREFTAQLDHSWETITNQLRHVMISTTCLESFDHVIGTHGTLIMHYFPLLTLWETIRTNNLPSLEQIRTPIEKRKNLLVPVHKPRHHRVNMLSALDTRGLLADADWSLTVNFDEDGELGDFLKTPNVSVSRYQTSATTPFVGKHKHTLPRTLPNDTVKKFADCIPLDKQFAGQYKWYIACETYSDLNFVTEKTFKGFLAGMPVLISGAYDTSLKLSQMLEFEMPFMDQYDKHCISNDDQTRYQRICDIVQCQIPDQEVIEYNFNVASNKRYLIATMIEQLVHFSHKKPPTRQ